MDAPSSHSRYRTTRRHGRRADVLAVIGLLVVAVGAHVGSLDDGLFFDDYWHRATLRELGWSFDDLVESATFDLPGRLAHLWWQEQPLQWRYARPVAMAVMKLELLLSGGKPAGVHVCALFWHALTTMLVYWLARWAVKHRGWAFVAGVLFAIQPHSVFAVSWIAARNALVSGCFFLAAICVYLSASVRRHERGKPLSIGGGLVASVLWGLALFSRETAIVFILLIPLLDLTAGGKRLFVRRIPVYTVMGLLATVYLYWRLLVFPIAGPPSIYFTAPGGALYALWAAGKLVHMLFALVFQTPFFVGIDTGGAWTATHAALYGVMLVLLAGIAFWYLITSRGMRTRWLWPVWVVAAFVPVIPVFVMPHFAYLPAAGLCIMLAVMLGRLRGRWRPVATALVIAGSLWSFGIYRYIWRGIVRSEQLIYADVRTNTSRPTPGSKLFFINLPVAGIYGAAAMREEWELDDLEAYVLTFAPHPLMMEDSCTVERVGERELIVTTETPGYFSGLSGRMLLEGMRPGSQLAAGTTVSGDLFDTTVLTGDEQGITKLRFVFHRPLDSRDYHFYVSSPYRPAYRLRFDQPINEISDGHARMFAEAHADDPDARRQARETIAQLAVTLAVQSADPIQTDLRDPQLSSNKTLDRVESWWRATGASQDLKEYTAWFSAAYPMLREREIYFRIDKLARRIIRSDLFLTGAETD